jgi:L-lactate permease
MAAYGLIAVMLFTMALQRASASIVNATLVGMETLLPAFVGIWLLGDTTKNGSFTVLIAGAALIIIGTIAVSLLQPAYVRARVKA